MMPLTHAFSCLGNENLESDHDRTSWGRIRDIAVHAVLGCTGRGKLHELGIPDKKRAY
jgi:hypothetical protein